MARLRSNFQRGSLSGSITSGATAVSSGEFSALPVVASPDYLLIVLDPEAVHGNPELIKVTAHTSSATSVTAVRGFEGTTARSHNPSTTWRHVPDAADWSLVRRDINVLEELAVGDNSTNDLTAFQNAVTDVATNGTIRVPTTTANRYLLTGSASGGTVLSITKNLTIEGDPSGSTVLKFGPADPSGTLSGFVLSDGVSLTLKNLTIEGPDTDSHSVLAIGVLAGVASGQNTSSTVKIHNCTMSKWGQNIKCQGDDTGHTVTHTVLVENSSLTGTGEGNNLLIFGSAAASMVTLRNSTFNQSPALASGFTSGQQHNLYLHLPVGLDAEGCTFQDTSGYNIQWTGGPSAAPSYIRVAGCRFTGTSSELVGAILQNSQTVSEVTDCSFQMPSAADCIRTETVELHLKGCDFLSGAHSLIVQGGNTAGRIIATNCLFQSQVSRNLTGSQWRFTNCTFKMGADAAPVSISATGGAFFTGCYFNIGAQTTAQMVVVSAGACTLRQCDFANGTLYAIGCSGTGSFDAADCTFDDDTKAFANSSSARCTLRPRQAIGANVTSGATVTLPINQNTVHITGTTAIDTIYVQDSTGSHNLADFGPYFVIFDAASSFTNAGNVQTALTPTTGNAYAIVKDGSAAKWYHQ